MTAVMMVGATLVTCAAAARLARVGHHVIVADRAPAPHLTWLADEPDIITMPAAWRDFFTKSGRPLAGSLGERGLELVPAAARELESGSLPDDRGAQWHSLSTALGYQAALTWQALLDQADDQWQALRRLGAEAACPDRIDRVTRAVLSPSTTLAGHADRLPDPLARLVRSLATLRGMDPARSPGWWLSRLAVERNFGRWQLRDTAGVAQPAGQLAAAVLQRCTERGVEFWFDSPVTRVRPGSVTLERRQVEASAVVLGVTPRTSTKLLGRKVPASGGRWVGAGTPLRAPRLAVGPGLLHASAASPAGPEGWAQLLTGALAAYRIHEDLTGEDMRPTNREYRRPPLRREQ